MFFLRGKYQTVSPYQFPMPEPSNWSAAKSGKYYQQKPQNVNKMAAYSRTRTYTDIVDI